MVTVPRVGTLTMTKVRVWVGYAKLAFNVPFSGVFVVAVNFPFTTVAATSLTVMLSVAALDAVPYLSMATNVKLSPPT
jgi:hypothetical protein